MTNLLVFKGFPALRSPFKPVSLMGTFRSGSTPRSWNAPFLDRGRLGDDGQPAFAIARQAHLVQHHPREIVEQHAEAVGRQVVCGALCGGLPPGGFRRPGRLHRRVPLRPGARAVVVLEQERREAPAHVPFHVQGQHAKKHVRADMVGGVDVDRTDPEVALCVAERALHAGERLVRVDGLRCAHGGGIQAGADDVDVVEPRLGVDPVLPPAPGDAVVGRVDLRCACRPSGG